MKKRDTLDTLFWCAVTILAALAVIFSLPADAQTPPPVHQATLTWALSPDQVIDPTLAITYNVWKLNGACAADGSFAFASATKLASNMTALTYTDLAVKVGQTYCYAVTAALGTAESGALPAAGTIPLAKVPVTVGTK